jgi:hypothetical protein
VESSWVYGWDYYKKFSGASSIGAESLRRCILLSEIILLGWDRVFWWEAADLSLLFGEFFNGEGSPPVAAIWGSSTSS